MAVKKWKGGVDAVAQIDTGEITGYDAASTYTVTIGDYEISTTGTTDAATTATTLVGLCNASNQPYFAAITWSVPTGAEVRAAGDVAGAPFAAALSVSGGTGTVTNFASTTACTGPHHIDNADNWSGGTKPVASDDVIIDGGPSLLYGLTDLTAVALASVDIRQSFTGSIGLEPSAFATSLDSQSLDASGIKEYRQTHLELDATLITIGEHDGPTTPNGSGRILIDQQKITASHLVVVNTATSTVTSAPAVRYLASDADADIDVRLAPGGVGVASDPGDTATVGELLVSDRTADSSLYVGEGTTLTSVQTFGGVLQLSAAATVTSAILGGEATIRGEGYSITTLTIVAGADVVDTHINRAGAEWGTINLRGGTLELPGVLDAADRSWTTCNVSRGRLAGDMGRLSSALTISIDAGASDQTAIDLSDL